MKSLQRLILRVKNNVRCKSERLTMIWVEPFGNGAYEVSCQLWDGVPRNGGRSIITQHSSMKEVDKQIDMIVAEYPNSCEDVTIYYDDVEE